MLERRWTEGLSSPEDVVDWVSTPVTLRDYRTGAVLYHHDGVEHPAGWSSNAVEICASKYLRRADIPDLGAESSVRQLARRVAACLRRHGERRGYFSNGDGQVFQDELIAGFLTQRLGFNSPVWFNYGLFSEYGIRGNTERRRYYYDYDAGEVRETFCELERPSGAACYLSGVSDSLFTQDETGMADLLSNEQKIFLTGAGDGVNVSDIRGTGEPISGGGTSSGLIAWLKVRDAAAGYIRSGGRTRRSATLLCCELDHPDILDFIEWKETEELKAQALLEKGFSGGMEGEAYTTVSGQNSNNSVRVSNAFMEAVEKDECWHLLSRLPLERFPDVPEGELAPGDMVSQGRLWLDGSGTPVALTRRGESVRRRIMRTLQARDLWRRICESAWRCGCPGIQFDDLINDWNTVPHYGRIRTTNPCAEICLPDWSVCNLGSINLIRFFEDLEHPDWEGFRHAVRLMTVALDLVADLSSYPTRRHAEGSMRLRSIGLNHGNIGAVLMRNGLAYDSDDGRFWMETITSAMTLEAYRMSLDLAARLGSYPEYRDEAHRRVLEMHRAAIARTDADGTRAARFPGARIESLRDGWRELCESPALREHGLRNNTVTTIPPQGTIGLVLDQDTLGCEPEFCLVKHKTLAGGGMMVMVNQSVEPALRRLGYTEDEIEKVCAWVRDYGTVEGCPVIREEAHFAVFDTAVRPGNTLDPACARLLRAPSHRDEAVRVIAGARSREEAARALPDHLQYLKDHVRVFTRSISVEGHVKALAALQPHLSHSISKTCNMDADATVEDVASAYRLAFRLGVKCIAIYRDGSKKAQPLQAGAAAPPAPALEAKADAPARDGWSPEAWPAVKRPTPNHTSNCDLFHFHIADPAESQGVFVNVALYPGSDDLMAIFVNIGRQGETTNGLVHSLARVISCALQHGVPPEEIGRKLAGMSFPPHGFLGETSAFGIHRAKSISDLIGRLLIALPAYYRSGRDPAVMHPRYESPLMLATESRDPAGGGGPDVPVGPSNAKQLGFTGRQCQNCGSYRTVGNAGCFVCRDCGHSNGPCAG